MSEITPTSLTLLFLCAAAWTVLAAACGGFFALWAAHVGKTGAHPLPKMPAITLFRRPKPAEDDDDDATSNGRARPGRGSIGP